MTERPTLFPPPPSHPSRSHNVSPRSSSSNLLRRVPPPPPPTRRVPSSEPINTAATAPSRVYLSEPVTGANANKSVDDFGWYDEPSPSDVQTLHEEELSEKQLRQLYDEEEINRFLYLFSTYVTEVNIPHSHSPSPSPTRPDMGDTVEADAPSGDEDGDWVDLVKAKKEPPAEPNNTPELGEGLAAWVASNILPYLPPAPPAAQSFSVKRARLTANRLFLALEPTYFPILKNLWELATWQSYGTSLSYCILYWWMWYNGLLLAGLLFRLLYALLRRRYLPYPNLAELRQYRKELELAESFSRNVIIRVVASPAINVRDVWSTFQEYRASRKKAKVEKDTHTATFQSQSADEPQIVVDDAGEDKTVSSEEEDVVKAILSEEHIWGPVLQIANRIADVHERIKNIFLWRRPRVSAAYCLLLFLCAVVVAALPAKVLVRGATMGLGIFFWHVVPVLAALPPSERSRIPPPLRHSATDAEYAMELISQRVASGLPIAPKRRKRSETPFGSKLDVSVAGISRDGSSLAGSQESTDDIVDWGKWGGRVARTQAWAGDVKGVLKDGNWKDLRQWDSVNPFSSNRPSNNGKRIETFTFPAQRGKSPGLITLADSTLYFTPLTSSKPELAIKLDEMLGVKKSGVARGIKVRWNEINSGGLQEERHERFLFVGDRDNLFARLVGWNAGKWAKS